MPEEEVAKTCPSWSLNIRIGMNSNKLCQYMANLQQVLRLRTWLTFHSSNLALVTSNVFFWQIRQQQVTINYQFQSHFLQVFCQRTQSSNSLSIVLLLLSRFVPKWSWAGITLHNFFAQINMRLSARLMVLRLGVLVAIKKHQDRAQQRY